MLFRSHRVDGNRVDRCSPAFGEELQTGAARCGIDEVGQDSLAALREHLHDRVVDQNPQVEGAVTEGQRRRVDAEEPGDRKNSTRRGSDCFKGNDEYGRSGQILFENGSFNGSGPLSSRSNRHLESPSA